MPLATRKSARRPAGSSRQAARPAAKSRDRVLIEFPSALLQRTDDAANAAGQSRSELIRAAVESHLDAIAAQAFEQQLAEAYASNSAMNLKLLKEFDAVDREGF